LLIKRCGYRHQEYLLGEEQARIISDLHFGKTGHFRKSGIAIPQSAFRTTCNELFEQIQHFSPVSSLLWATCSIAKPIKNLSFF
jgi:metallophosphoesterase superfamily enzyme